ncbi:hypothetical protein SAMN04488115_10898 [Bosea lathyri]|uniref:Ribbon-helix-helix protein, copG family n=2 Tax=Bosea lathyri TaxID=1036778 RepID=A0A1H6BUX9_9HYPH|nr:hypothetical protein SAMN04488115_10898 [Bosea lathyri]
MARKTKYAEGTRQVSMRMPLDLLGQIDKRARRVNAPRAEVIVDTLRSGLSGEPAPTPAVEGSIFE